MHCLFSEYCNPGCFTELAGEFDMLPGLVADINLKSCVSQEPLDMISTVNQQRYMAALEDQDPYLVMGRRRAGDIQNSRASMNGGEIPTKPTRRGKQMQTTSRCCISGQRSTKTGTRRADGFSTNTLGMPRRGTKSVCKKLRHYLVSSL